MAEPALPVPSLYTEYNSGIFYDRNRRDPGYF